MELKPENEEKEVKYPSEENVDKEKLKKPLKKWQKVGITAAALAGIGVAFSIGYYLFTDTVDGGVHDSIYDIDKLNTEAFNSQFISYTGDHVKGSTVKRLISLINATRGSEHQVTVNNSDKGISISSINSGKFYKVEEEYDADGCINNINITEVVEEKIEEPQNVENMESE